jgi:hypothetical protein
LNESAPGFHVEIFHFYSISQITTISLIKITCTKYSSTYYALSERKIKPASTEHGIWSHSHTPSPNCRQIGDVLLLLDKKKIAALTPAKHFRSVDRPLVFLLAHAVRLKKKIATESVTHLVACGEKSRREPLKYKICSDADCQITSAHRSMKCFLSLLLLLPNAAHA